MSRLPYAALTFLTLFSAPAHAQCPEPRAVLIGHKDDVGPVAFSPDGRLLASAGHCDETLRLWDTATGQELAVLTKHSRVGSVVFSPGGGAVATVSSYPTRMVGRRRIFQEETVDMWDVVTGRSRVILRTPDVVFALGYSPDGRFLAISLAGLEEKTLLWNVRSESVVSSLQGLKLPSFPFSNAIAFSYDGSTMATTGGHDVILWDTRTWQQRVVLTGHTLMPNSVSFSPDGMWVSSGGDDDTVRVWYMNTNNLKATLRGFHGHVDSVAFSPDSKLLAAACRDGTFRLFEPDTFNTLVVVKAHSNAVWSVVFSPDGKTIATGSRDHTIKLWDTASLVRVARARLRSVKK